MEKKSQAARSVSGLALPSSSSGPTPSSSSLPGPGTSSSPLEIRSGQHRDPMVYHETSGWCPLSEYPDFLKLASASCYDRWKRDGILDDGTVIEEPAYWDALLWLAMRSRKSDHGRLEGPTTPKRPWPTLEMACEAEGARSIKRRRTTTD